MADIYGGTATGPQTQAGVPIDIWNSWTEQTQDMYLEDYYRTDAQQNYQDIWAEDWRNPLAYVYTGYVDFATGLDSSEVGATTNQAIDTFKDASRASLDVLKDTKDQAVGIAILLGLSYVATR